jgi:hypothetical protein
MRPIGQLASPFSTSPLFFRDDFLAPRFFVVGSPPVIVTVYPKPSSAIPSRSTVRESSSSACVAYVDNFVSRFRRLLLLWRVEMLCFVDEDLFVSGKVRRLLVRCPKKDRNAGAQAHIYESC